MTDSTLPPAVTEPAPLPAMNVSTTPPAMTEPAPLPTMTGHLSYERIASQVIQISLSDIGFAEDAEYRALAFRTMVLNYYPTERTQLLAAGPMATVDALTDPVAIRDVCAVVEMIKDHQRQFYERVANATPYLFGLSTDKHSREVIKEYVQGLLCSMRFIHLHGRENFMPFTVPVIVRAIRRGVSFKDKEIPVPDREDDNYVWLNHRTIKLATVALFHGLLRWVNGRYLRPDVLVSQDTLIGRLSQLPLACAHAPNQITDAIQRITR